MINTSIVIDAGETAESFHLRMPAELLRSIEALARREHRTVANMIRLLLREALDAREKP
jgi:hypothetical protein